MQSGTSQPRLLSFNLSAFRLAIARPVQSRGQAGKLGPSYVVRVQSIPVVQMLPLRLKPVVDAVIGRGSSCWLAG